jgi:hypothetical protein
VRALAVGCLGLLCALGAALAARYWPLLAQVAARDTGAVRAAALKGLADVLCAFTPAHLQVRSSSARRGAAGGPAARSQCGR